MMTEREKILCKFEVPKREDLMKFWYEDNTERNLEWRENKRCYHARPSQLRRVKKPTTKVRFS